MDFFDTIHLAKEVEWEWGNLQLSEFAGQLLSDIQIGANLLNHPNFCSFQNRQITSGIQQGSSPVVTTSGGKHQLVTGSSVSSVSRLE